LAIDLLRISRFPRPLHSERIAIIHLGQMPRGITMRKIVGLLLGASLVTVAPVALAAGGDFATSGTFAVAIERAFGFYGYSASFSQEEPLGRVDSSAGGTMINLLWGNSAVDSGGGRTALALNPFAIPRVAFDYFVANGWSVGGSIGYAHTSGRYRVDSAPRPQSLGSWDLSDVDLFEIAPRGGYCYMFSSVIGIWPRLGFTYGHMGITENDNNGTKVSSYVFDLDIEAMLTIVPVQHVGILVGPLLDIPLAGNSSTTVRPPNLPPPDTSVHLWNYGVAAGLLAYF
jgi:hypothetical protein